MVYDYEYFKKEVYKLTKIDLNAYKEKQMKRRIDTLIAKNGVSGYKERQMKRRIDALITKRGIKSYDAYVNALRTDVELMEEFVTYLTINVSEFYRNPDQWELLDKEVIPGLINRFGKDLKIWSAACSTGDEPYSLVMALSRHLPLSHIHIIATDIDKQVIEKAKIGLYTEKSIAAVPEDLKRRFFTKVGASYQIEQEIKDCVEFKQHNLLKDEYPTHCHMIVCRNVLIYFTEEAKEEVFAKFSKSLIPEGCLFIGSTEQIIQYKDMGYYRMNSFFYGKNK